jgi:hypothetical protein
MKEYRYTFEKHPKKKGTCPQCSQKNKLRFYENKNGDRQNEKYGKCDRINECGYVLYPGSDIIKPAKLPQKTKMEDKIILPDEKTKNNLQGFLKNQTSNFHEFWLKKGITESHFTKHDVGTDSKGNTVFVHRNREGNIANAKFVKYTFEAKRDKENSFYLKQPIDKTSQYFVPLYGINLLSSDQDKFVIVVESEKTCVLAAYYYPQYDWVACGSCNGLTEDKLQALKDRKIIWLCDADEAGRKNSSLKNLEKSGFEFYVLDFYHEKNDGYDIADDFELSRMPDLEIPLNELFQKAIENRKIFLNNDIVEFKPNYSISIRNKKDFDIIADDFLIHIKYQTKNKLDETTWILEILRLGKPPIYKEVNNSDFCTAKELRKILATDRLSFKATDAQLTELQALLFTQDFDTAEKLIQLGLHKNSEIFFFANVALTADGRIIKPDEFNIVKEGNFSLCLPTLSKVDYKRFTFKENSVKFQTWYELFITAHTHEKAFITTSHYIMALFRDIMVDFKGSSPILFLKGTFGSGKSSIIRSITCLFGYQQPDINLKASNTDKALTKLLSRTYNCMVWMDEFENNALYESLLQACYDNAGYHRSTDKSVSTTDTESIDINSALVLTSNFVPSNSIFLSRCILMHIEKNTKTQKQRNAFDRIRELETHSLACISIEILAFRKLIKENYKKVYSILIDEFKQRLENENYHERLFTNMVQTLICPFILQTNGKIFLTESVDPKDILEDYISMGINLIREQNDVMEGSSILSDFITIVNILAESGKLIQNIHYRFQGKYVSIRLPVVYNLYKEKFWQINHKEPAERDSIVQEIYSFENSRDQKSILKTIRFKEDVSDNDFSKSVNNSLCITYEIFASKYGLNLKSLKT